MIYKTKKNRSGKRTTVLQEGETTKEIDLVSQKMDLIRKNEVLASIPRRVLPSIPKSELIREAQRAEVARRQWGDFEKVIQGGGQKLHELNSVGKFYMDGLADITAIRNEVKQIQPQPAPKFEGISY